jgi:EKC/KEOPS complex subunit GON7
MTQENQKHLNVTYNASTEEPQVFQHGLPDCSENPSTDQRTAYLAALRSSVTQVQAEVNIFLTKKMEEDNAKSGKGTVNDEKEEENYGEEVVDEGN